MMRWLPIIILFELGRFSSAQKCGNPIFFDNAEKLSTKEWKINGEGSLNIIRSDTNFYAYEYKGRTKDADIVSRELNAGCFVEGVPYAITARFKLVNSRGRGYSCSKTSKVVGHRITCPVFFLDLTLPNGAQKRMQLFNEHTVHLNWKSKTFNEHISRFTGTKDLASATKIILSISGYDFESTLTFDDVKIDFDCETLFHNSYAELGNTKNWKIVDGGGKLRFTNRKYEGRKSFIHWRRSSPENGVGQYVNTFCLKKGKQFEFTAQLMVLNQADKQVTVGKWSKPGADSYLVLTARIKLPSGEVKTIDFRNENPSSWDPKIHNEYRSIIRVDDELASATEVFFYLHGPAKGYSIVYDNIFLREYDRNCYSELFSGDDEGGKYNFVGLTVGEPSYLNRVFRGKGSYFFEHQNRGKNDPGVFYDVDPSCFYEGMKYVFTSKLKLRDKKGKILDCKVNVKEVGADLSCPMVYIKLSLPSGDKMIEHRFSEYKMYEWNNLSFEFIASADFARASKITIGIRGPGEGVNVLIDNNDFDGLWPSTIPTSLPSIVPSPVPTGLESPAPSGKPTEVKSPAPSGKPTVGKSPAPSGKPTVIVAPNKPTGVEDSAPSSNPTEVKTDSGTGTSSAPSETPTSAPTATKSMKPSVMKSEAPTSHAPTTEYCSLSVFNGDASMGTKHWNNSNGGNLLVVDGAFKYTSRTSIWSGPEQSIQPRCMRLGTHYEFTARLALRDEDDKPTFCNKDAAWRNDHFCVVLSIKRKNKTGTKIVNFANEESSLWVEDQYNIFRTVFTATYDLSSSDEIFFSLIGPRKGVSIIFDDVEFHEIGADAPPCNELIVNGNIKDGKLGWSAVENSQLDVEKKGEGATDLVLKNSHRTTSYSGISQQLNPVCIIPDVVLEVKGMMKIVDSEGRPVKCDKSVQIMGHDDHCPTVSLKIITSADVNTKPSVKIIELENEDTSEWVAEEFNSYRSIFKAPNVSGADSVAVVIAGVRSSASIVIDEIYLEESMNEFLRSGSDFAENNDDFFGIVRPHTSVDEEESVSEFVQSAPAMRAPKKKEESLSAGPCSELIMNGDAESGKLTGWSAAYFSSIGVNQHGANGSEKSFESYARSQKSSGPRHYLNMDCMEEGSQYELTAYIKLKNLLGEPYKSNKHAVWDDNSFLTASVHLRTPMSDGGEEILNLPNYDPSKWSESDYNLYRSILTVGPEFAGATEVFLFFRGPETGVSIDFDDVSLSKYVSPRSDCKDLITYGEAKDEMLVGWSLTEPNGYVDIVKGMGMMANSFFKNSERTSIASGPKYILNANCLKKTQYEFGARIKLQSQSGLPVSCNKNPAFDDNKNCPIVRVQYVSSGGDKKMIELANMDKNEWMNDDLNRYYSTFTIMDDIDVSQEAHVSITGPPFDVSILFDDVFLRVFEASKCNKLVMNGGAEDQQGRTTKPWGTYYGGQLSVLTGGGANGSSRYFKHAGRTSYTSGPKQMINMDCLVEGMRYEFRAKVKLEDERNNNEPFYCSEEEEWKSDFYCVILSIKLKDATGNKILNLPNESTDYWNESEFNNFRAVFKATRDLMQSSEMFFVLRGPKAGVSILFDEVSITLYEAPARQ